jgi:hypothetical protein
VCGSISESCTVQPQSESPASMHNYTVEQVRSSDFPKGYLEQSWWNGGVKEMNQRKSDVLILVKKPGNAGGAKENRLCC